MKKQLMIQNYFLFENDCDLSTYNHLSVTVKSEKEIRYIKKTKEGIIMCVVVPIAKSKEALKLAQKLIISRKIKNESA